MMKIKFGLVALCTVPTTAAAPADASNNAWLGVIFEEASENLKTIPSLGNGHHDDLYCTLDLRVLLPIFDNLVQLGAPLLIATARDSMACFERQPVEQQRLSKVKGCEMTLWGIQN